MTKTPKTKATRSSIFLIRVCFILFGSAVFSVTCYFLFSSYQDHVNPEQIYGDWIEIGAPKYQTDILNFSSKGFTHNHRLISTKFDYDGKKIHIKTNAGETTYELSGTFSSPQLLRIVPRKPRVTFIKKGYEHTIEDDQSNAIQSRGKALSEHFNASK
ncbi:MULTISPECIES: DUF2850 domain-containing protein [Vibrio]|uniref:DUF2850 domain-containing protein n=1 Tax=Vibrio genomosp. F6 str. FF-238 TaxID=1191298 RepID=A0A1E5DD08_9VIBR|nr:MULTISPECIES: DUF2850 domain-containing protein [Vibrio]NOH82370.1 DUF2850 domain-containing protein [Vibrio sp. 03-59-1]OEE81425.1 hypothetical protein A130_00100 [Vibrio genomosp. F6 str. FF-238]